MFRRDLTRSKELWYSALSEAEKIGALTVPEIVVRIESRNRSDLSAHLMRSIVSEPADIVVLTENCDMITWAVSPLDEPVPAPPAEWLDQVTVYVDGKNKNKKRQRKDDNRNGNRQNNNDGERQRSYSRRDSRASSYAGYRPNYTEDEGSVSYADSVRAYNDDIRNRDI